jgi:peptidoglycan/LPS O-acetylase OafA/YrhL
MKPNLLDRGDLQSVNALRGMAALMVCYFHFGFGNREYLPDSSWVKQTAEFGWSGVEFFFIISGFIIPYSMHAGGYKLSNWFTFMKKRVIRIEPPYIASVLLIVVLNSLASSMPGFNGTAFSADWSNILGHFAYVNAFTGGKWLNDVYWTLAIEFEFYILASLLFPLISSPNRIYRWTILILLALSMRLAIPHGPHINSFITFFISGILLYQWQCRIMNEVEFAGLTLSVLIFYVMDSNPLFFILTLTAILLITGWKKIPRFLLFLGAISYSLYLIHIPVGGKFINLAQRMIVSPSVAFKEILVFMALIFTISISYIFNILIERPFKTYASTLRYKKQRSNQQP